MNSRHAALVTAEIERGLLEPLADTYDITYAGWAIDKKVLDEGALVDRLRGMEVLVTSYDKVTATVIESSPSLRLVVCTRSNPVNVDQEAARKAGISVAYTPGRNSDATAEFAVGLLLAVSRNIARANHMMLEGELTTDDAERPGPLRDDVTWGAVKQVHPYVDLEGPQIFGKTMGIIGFGSIGSRVGRLMGGFGAEVIAYDPYLTEKDVAGAGVRLVDLDELLRTSDFISCHMKVTDSTRGLIDAAAFDKMKRTGFLVNNSRGAILVEEDLIDALREYKIAGAALDVYAFEPLWAGHPFLTERFDNLVMTPHISGACEDAIRNHTAMAVDELRRFAAGDAPSHGWAPPTR